MKALLTLNAVNEFSDLIESLNLSDRVPSAAELRVLIDGGGNLALHRNLFPLIKRWLNANGLEGRQIGMMLRFLFDECDIEGKLIASDFISTSSGNHWNQKEKGIGNSGLISITEELETEFFYWEIADSLRDGQVNDAARYDRYPHRDTSQFSGQFWNRKANRFRSSG